MNIGHMNSGKNWWQHVIDSPLVLALSILLLALGPRIRDLAVFVGPDEFYWVTGSANFARALVTGDLAKTYHAGQPGVTLMWIETLGAWLKYDWQLLWGSATWDAILSTDNTMAMLASARQTAAVANALLLVLIVLLARQVFGAGTAWLAGFLLAFDPFLLTESRAVRTEALVTAFGSLALLSLLLYLTAPRLRMCLLASILSGLALLSKISAIALVPVAILIFLRNARPNLSREARGNRRAAMLMLLVWGTGILLTVVILWPALWVGPLDVFEKMYEFSFSRAVEGDGGGKSFFLGQTFPDEAPGLLFYPMVLLYRTSPLLWLGLISLALMIWPAHRVPGRDLNYVGIILLFVVIYIAVITRSELKFDRYIVPILPALSLLAALGLVTAWHFLSASRPRLRQFGWALALLVLSAQAALALPHHPYYYAYWNPLLGGLKQAVRVLPVGIGGEGLDRVAAYLNKLPNAEKISVASANSQKIRPIFKGQTIAMDNLDGKWVQADYGLIYISQLQRGKHAEDILAYLARRRPEYTLWLNDVAYAWLYPAPAAQFYGGGHKLEGRGTLFGFDLSKTEAAAGESFAVKLYWRNEGQRQDDRFFVRLMDLDGYTWTEAIAQPRPGFEAANQQENSIVESEAVLNLPIGMPPGDYFLKPGFKTAAGALIGYFELPAETQPIKVTKASSYLPVAAFRPPHSSPLVINEDLMLQGYDLEFEAAAPEPRLWATLYWQALSDIGHDYVILLRLLDNNRQEVAYWLGRPVRSGYPTPAWRAGQIVQDPWLLALPAEAGPGPYRLEIAVFDADSEVELGRRMVSQVEFD